MLIVEDNAPNLELMSYLLRAFGYAHTVARDGVEALDIARRERPDLIICDIQLPRMDGYQVLQDLKRDASFRNTPIIAVTALAMVGDRDKILASGFTGYIAKPIQPDTFVPQVEKYLDQSQRSAGQIVQEQAPASPGPAAREFRGSTILVVDDVEENRALARGLLESCGYLVRTAASVQEAFEALRRDLPNLILCDFRLTDGTGLDVFDGIRGQPRLQEVPFMLISSSILTPEERTTPAHKGIKLLLRPIDSQRLLAEIESLCSAGLPGGTT